MGGNTPGWNFLCRDFPGKFTREEFDGWEYSKQDFPRPFLCTTKMFKLM